MNLLTQAWRSFQERGGLIEVASRLIGTTLASLGIRYRLFRSHSDVEFPEIDIAIDNLPPAFIGFRIAHLSDVHHSCSTVLEDLEELVEMVNRRRPDLVVMTGDYISHHQRFFQPCIEVLERLEAPYGILATVGNHDYYEGIEHVEECFGDGRARLLINQSVVIEKDGQKLGMAGIDDFERGKPDLRRSLRDLPRGWPRVLLSHSPDAIEAVGEGEVDLVLAGHTHGGMIRLPLIGPPRVPGRYGRKYLEGLLRGPHVTAYVSRGIGATVLPMRYRCPPEVPLIRLVRR